MTQSKAELTTDKQILYLVQWFAEFSDFQRADFLADHLLPLYAPFLGPKLLSSIQTDDAQLINGGDGAQKTVIITNGLASLDLDQTKPPSIFQCRMKLFTDWFTSWPDNDRLEFLLRLRNIDSGFLSEFYRVLLHQNGINSYDQLQDLEKSESDRELLTRLEINEKVFESKLPDLSRLSVGDPAFPDSVFANNNNQTPDLLNEVVGIKDPGSDKDSNEELQSRLEACEQPLENEEEEEEIQEVVMTEVSQPETLEAAPEIVKPEETAEEVVIVQDREEPEGEEQVNKEDPTEPEKQNQPEQEELLQLEDPILAAPVTNNAVPDLVA